MAKTNYKLLKEQIAKANYKLLKEHIAIKTKYKWKHLKGQYRYISQQGTYKKEKKRNHWYQVWKTYKPLMGG